MTGARTSSGACGLIRCNAKNLTWARNAEDDTRNGLVRKDFCIGAAWLSSARAVRCWVKSRNERNPYRQLPTRNGGDSSETAWVNQEEGEDDVKSAWPLCPGLHTCYNGRYRRQRNRKVKQIPKTDLSSDCSLQLGYMKLELLVMACQQQRREYVPGPCTHRPSHHGSWFYPKSLT